MCIPVRYFCNFIVQFCGSVTFWYGSGFFVSGWQDANKNKLFKKGFCLFRTFWRYIYTSLFLLVDGRIQIRTNNDEYGRPKHTDQDPQQYLYYRVSNVLRKNRFVHHLPGTCLKYFATQRYLGLLILLWKALGCGHLRQRYITGQLGQLLSAGGRLAAQLLRAGGQLAQLLLFSVGEVVLATGLEAAADLPPHQLLQLTQVQVHASLLRQQLQNYKI